MTGDILIDSTKLSPDTSRPVSFVGKHSGRKLAGIDLSLTIHERQEQELRSLLEKRSVSVTDPFGSRTYDGTFRQKSYSYQDGRPERHFAIEIREIDKPPDVHELEIDGHRYTVLRYFEDDPTPETIGMHVLVKMSEGEFVDFQSSRFPEKLHSIQRVGFDEQPLTMRYGGMMYWSRHHQGESTYCKQIVRLFPPEPAPSAITIPSVWDLVATMRLVVDATFRLEALIKELQNLKVIDEGKANLLLGNSSELVDADRRRAINWELERQNDAEDQFE